MPAVSAATCQVLSTGSPVDDGQRLTVSQVMTHRWQYAAVLTVREDDEMFLTRSLNVTPKTTEQRS